MYQANIYWAYAIWYVLGIILGSGSTRVNKKDIVPTIMALVVVRLMGIEKDYSQENQLEGSSADIR